MYVSPPFQSNPRHSFPSYISNPTPRLTISQERPALSLLSPPLLIFTLPLYVYYLHIIFFTVSSVPPPHSNFTTPPSYLLHMSSFASLFLSLFIPQLPTSPYPLKSLPFHFNCSYTLLLLSSHHFFSFFCLRNTFLQYFFPYFISHSQFRINFFHH